MLKHEIFDKYGEDVVFVVPFIIQEELEYIKSLFSNRKAELKYLARQALKLLDYWSSDNRAFHLQDPRIAEYTYAMANAFKIRNNDDRAVHCALYYQEWYGNYNVVMCSEDLGVRLTARSVNVIAYSVQTLAKWARTSPANRSFYAIKDVPPPTVSYRRRNARYHGSSKSRFSKKAAIKNSTKSKKISRTVSKYSKTIPVRAARHSVITALQNVRATSGIGGGKATTSAKRTHADQVMTSLSRLMIVSLSELVEAAMIQKYGKNWEGHLKVPKPYSIVNALLAIDRLWLDVFSPFWDEVNQVIHNQRVVQHLSAAFQNGAASDADVWDVFEDIKQLWIAVDPSSLTVASSRYKVSMMKLQTQMKLARLAESFAKQTKSGGGGANS